MIPSLTGYQNEKRAVSMPGKTRSPFAYQQLENASYVTIDANLAPKVEEVRVDMADMKVENGSVELLTSVGSCVAICLHDSVHKCGGLAHVMLPHSSDVSHEPLPSKYADTAIPALVEGIRKMCGKDLRLSAKIAGGANMFANLGSDGNLDIGGKNVRAAREGLSNRKIRLIGEDVGGLHGRRISFNVSSGVMMVKSFNGENKKL
jgi:chemotaxis protein CheD